MLLEAHYHEDMTRFHVNTLPKRNYYIPYSDKVVALNAKSRKESDRFIDLNGQWKFAYMTSFDDIADKTLEQVSALCRDEITVPSVWQYQGYGQLSYLNERFAIPF